MARAAIRAKVVEPLGSRGSRKIKTIDGEERRIRPTVDSLVKQRVKKHNKRLVIRFNRGTK